MKAVDNDKLANYLGQRITAEHLNTRLNREQRRDNWFETHDSVWRNLKTMRFWTRVALWGTGMRRRGQRNALALRLTHNSIECSERLQRFKGLQILHISDLHIDANPGYGEVMARTIEGVNADVTMITGDFRARSFGSTAKTLQMMEELAPSIPNINGHCYAILGNHDPLSLVPELEGMGMTCLVNETTVMPTKDGQLVISGVDDPHFYKTHNLEACQLPANVSAVDSTIDQMHILLAHTPRLIAEASELGFDLYLTGHLHGGQMCWPNGKPLHPRLTAPRRFQKGAWQEKGMEGYTSSGSGTSIVDARFFCPPEVTLHTFV